MIMTIIKIIAFVLLFIAIVVWNRYFLAFVFGVIRLKPKYGRHSKRFYRRVWLGRIRQHSFGTILDFIKWICIDAMNNRDYSNVFGIWAFVGYYGEGKSLGAVTYARKQIDKAAERGHKIWLASNHKIKGMDFWITCWQDLLMLPDNCIVVFDELQNTFMSARYRDFPIELLEKLTQSRKKRMAIFCTSPVYKRMSVQIRDSCSFIVECKNIMGMSRWFNYTFYRKEEYETIAESIASRKIRQLKKERRIRTETVIASDLIYKQYDTHVIIDRFDIKPKDEEPVKIDVAAVVDRMNPSNKEAYYNLIFSLSEVA